MEPFTRVTGILAPLDRVNVDTDQIIPKQFLKRIADRLRPVSLLRLAAEWGLHPR